MNATHGPPLGAHELGTHGVRYQEASAELHHRTAAELSAGRNAHQTPGMAYKLLQESLLAAHALFKDCQPIASNCWQLDAVSLAVREFFSAAHQRLAWGSVLGKELQLTSLGDQIFVHAPENMPQPVEPFALLAAIIEHGSERAYLQALARTYGLRPEEADLLVRLNAQARPIYNALVGAISDINRTAYGNKVERRQGSSIFVTPSPVGNLTLHHPAHGARIDLFGALQPCSPDVFGKIVNAVGPKNPEAIAELYTIHRETSASTPPPAPSPTSM